MEKWLESVYSDGSSRFVSNPSPKLGDTVTVQIRMYDDAPVKHVLLRSVPNGAQHIVECAKLRSENGLDYYAAELRINENRVHYQFYLVCEDVI